MKQKEYIKNVLVTEARDMAPLQQRFSEVRNIRLLHGVIGLGSELAELREMVQAEEIDVVNLKEEMGDMFWYMGIMIDELGLTPELVMVDSLTIDEEDIVDKRLELNLAIDEITIAVGKTLDLLKKSIMYGKELSTEDVMDQLIVIDIFICTGLALYGISPGEARERNIEKLRARYGQKFTEAAALERNLAKERKILSK